MSAAEFGVSSYAAPVSGVAPTGPWRRARWLLQRMLSLGRRSPRRLRLCESLPLGDRRFVAVVEFESSRFLVGGTSASLVLLARLERDVDEIFRNEGDTSPMESAAESFPEVQR